jgi:4-coumarate--CoA ligase
VPDRAAFIDGGDGRRVTYVELDELIHRFAGGLVERGFEIGDTVAIMSPNVAEYAVALHGTAVAGGTVTTLNPTYTADEVNHQLRDVGARMMVVDAAVLAVARAAAVGTAVTEIVTIGESPGETPMSSLYGERVGQRAIDPADAVAVVPYSSGTTGLPKGVMLTHANLVANLAQCEHVLAYHVDDEVGLAALPFFHVYGMQIMNGLLSLGGTIVSMRRFDLAEALALVQTQRITRFFAVPPMVFALARHPIVARYDLSSLRTISSAAAPLGADLQREAALRVGCEVTQGYGMTELSPVSHATPPGQTRFGSVGVTISNTQCRIIGPDGDDLGADDHGELLVRGPQVMRGYLRNQQATGDTIDDDGWLHTGDVGRFDDAGHLFILGRVKELIKYKGFQVAPAELEAVLATHPDVADVAVAGIPDEEAGEVPKAFVVLRPGARTTTEELREFLGGKVATFKQLRAVEIVEQIPRSAAGKILRHLLPT